MQHKSVPLLIKSADDQSGLVKSPRQRPPVGLTDTVRILRTGGPLLPAPLQLPEHAH